MRTFKTLSYILLLLLLPGIALCNNCLNIELNRIWKLHQPTSFLISGIKVSWNTSLSQCFSKGKDFWRYFYVSMKYVHMQTYLHNFPFKLRYTYNYWKLLLQRFYNPSKLILVFVKHNTHEKKSHGVLIDSHVGEVMLPLDDNCKVTENEIQIGSWIHFHL